MPDHKNLRVFYPYFTPDWCVFSRQIGVDPSLKYKTRQIVAFPIKNYFFLVCCILQNKILITMSSRPLGAEKPFSLPNQYWVAAKLKLRNESDNACIFCCDYYQHHLSPNEQLFRSNECLGKDYFRHFRSTLTDLKVFAHFMPTNNPIFQGCPGCCLCSICVGRAKHLPDSTIIEIQGNNSMNPENMNIDEPDTYAIDYGYDDHQQINDLNPTIENNTSHMNFTFLPQGHEAGIIRIYTLCEYKDVVASLAVKYCITEISGTKYRLPVIIAGDMMINSSGTYDDTINHEIFVRLDKFVSIYGHDIQFSNEIKKVFFCNCICNNQPQLRVHIEKFLFVILSRQFISITSSLNISWITSAEI